MGLIEYRKKTNRIFSELQCHFHTVYEIYYFISGDCEILVDSVKYKLTPHSLMLIAPNVLHGIQVNSNADYERTCLYLRGDELLPERQYLLESVMHKHSRHFGSDVYYENTESYHLDELFLNLKNLETQSEEMKALLEPIYTEALMAKIYTLCNEQRPSTENHTMPSKISDVANYITSHITENLNLDDIANNFFISKNYLNKTFKQVTGVTVMDFVRLKRVLLAKSLMQKGAQAIDAALQVGFADYSSFYRAYVKYMYNGPREDLKKPLPF